MAVSPQRSTPALRASSRPATFISARAQKGRVRATARKGRQSFEIENRNFVCIGDDGCASNPEKQREIGAGMRWEVTTNGARHLFRFNSHTIRKFRIGWRE